MSKDDGRHATPASDGLIERLRARKIVDASRGYTRAPTEEEAEAADVIESLRSELAAVCVAVGRSKDGTGYDVDWHELHKQCARSENAPSEAYPGIAHDLETSEYKRGLLEGALSRLLEALVQHPSPDLHRAVDNAKAILKASLSSGREALPDPDIIGHHEGKFP